MPAQFSDPIAIAAATAAVFAFYAPTTKVRVAVVFYTTEDALPGEEVAIGSGTRDIAVSTTVAAMTLPITGASVSAQPALTFKIFDLGVPTSRISIVCAAATDPGTATHYRVWVEG